ncbi:unnamed protein product [marine sediment metagenome]|uniref:Ethanolamine utilization protein EutN n=1 Tax=marine sediment metagenome TaxID=412755 RepID=X1G1D9_9ZZZZ
MILGKVVGNVVSTIKLPVYQGYKILIVQPVNDKQKPQGKSILALDTVQAGVGDTVLVIDEGNSSRLIMNNSTAPVRTMIVGIVDAISAGVFICILPPIEEPCMFLLPESDLKERLSEEDVFFNFDIISSLILSINSFLSILSISIILYLFFSYFH